MACLFVFFDRNRASDIKLSGPPLPRFPNSSTVDTPTTPNDAEDRLLPSLFIQDKTAVVHSLSEILPSLAVSSCSVEPIQPTGRPHDKHRWHPNNNQIQQRPRANLFSKSYSFPFRLHDEPILEVPECQGRQQSLSDDSGKPAFAPSEKRLSLPSELVHVKEATGMTREEEIRSSSSSTAKRSG